jgi:hypothetical protein
MRAKQYAYPRIGRLGLGNQLFPFFRALDLFWRGEARLIPPRWFKIRIGPWTRRERDHRNYWLLFRKPNIATRLIRLSIDIFNLIERVLALKSTGMGMTVIRPTGMGNYFADLAHAPERYRAYLVAAARPGCFSAKPEIPYLAFHVRLGDFTRQEDTVTLLSANNRSTPLRWYAAQVEQLAENLPELPIYIASDGDDQELLQLLSRSNVTRTTARNALDEMFWLANAAGIVGSRSTFTAWGAFLGEVPLLVFPGGNAYRPHQQVWEADGSCPAWEWLSAVRVRAAKFSSSPGE